jgi:hypothetical protein
MNEDWHHRQSQHLNPPHDHRVARESETTVAATIKEGVMESKPKEIMTTKKVQGRRQGS